MLKLESFERGPRSHSSTDVKKATTPPNPLNEMLSYTTSLYKKCRSCSATQTNTLRDHVYNILECKLWSIRATDKDFYTKEWNTNKQNKWEINI